MNYGIAFLSCIGNSDQEKCMDQTMNIITRIFGITSVIFYSLQWLILGWNNLKVILILCFLYVCYILIKFSTIKTIKTLDSKVAFRKESGICTTGFPTGLPTSNLKKKLKWELNKDKIYNLTTLSGENRCFGTKYKRVMD